MGNAVGSSASDHGSHSSRPRPGGRWCAHVETGGRAAAAAAIAAARTEHLAALLKFVRAHSALYRDRWSDVPKDAPLEALPVVPKRALMDDFDRWVTEPSLTRAGVEAFLSDRAHIGERHLGR